MFPDFYVSIEFLVSFVCIGNSMFQVHVTILVKSMFQNHITASSLDFKIIFIIYFHVSIVHVFVCLCFNIPIHLKQHSSNNFYGFLGFFVSCFVLFTCDTFSLVMVPLCFMFWVCCNIDFFVFFLAEWLGGTWGVAPSSWKLCIRS